MRKCKALAIPWTTTDPRKEAKYRRIIKEYFKEPGIETTFLERENPPTKIEEKFRTADIIYLPGGNPLTLLKEIRKRGVDKHIKAFKGLVIGNSAGALILSSCFLTTKKGKSPSKG